MDELEVNTASSMDGALEEVHWTQLFGNPFSKAFHPNMMLDGGYKVIVVGYLKGQSRAMGAQSRLVTFDRSYVVAKLRSLRKQLQLKDYKQYQSLFAEVWKDS